MTGIYLARAENTSKTAYNPHGFILGIHDMSSLTALKILAKKLTQWPMCQFSVVMEIEKLKIEKYAFSFEHVDTRPLLNQSTCGNNYHGNICMVIITTGTLV